MTRIFAEAPAGAVRILTFHHNVLRGGISRRMGLANWRAAYRRLLATGADVILCGHDHHEGAGQIEGALAVSTAGTHSFRTRGGRPSVFNLVRIDDRAVHIQHYRWEAGSAGGSSPPTRTPSPGRGRRGWRCPSPAAIRGCDVTSCSPSASNCWACATSTASSPTPTGP